MVSKLQPACCPEASEHIEHRDEWRLIAEEGGEAVDLPPIRYCPYCGTELRAEIGIAYG